MRKFYVLSKVLNGKRHLIGELTEESKKTKSTHLSIGGWNVPRMVFETR